MQNVLPTVADVAEAHLRIRDWIVETPVLESEALSRRIGARVLLKAECLQRGGSFKIRGALNRLASAQSCASAAPASSRSRRGITRKAVAIAARWLNCRATIVMPADAPRTKLEGTRAYGAEVVLYDRERDDREAIAARLAAERGAALVPPFDHAHVIAGQGTAALELGRTLALAARDPRRPLRALQRRRSRRRLGARDQVPVSRLRRLRRRATSVTRGSPIRCAAGERRVVTGHPRDPLRRPPRADARRDHLRDRPARARGRRRRRRRCRARGDGARSRAPQGRRRAVGRRRARRRAAQPATAELRRRDPFGRQRRRGIVVERRDAPREKLTTRRNQPMSSRLSLRRESETVPVRWTIMPRR